MRTTWSPLHMMCPMCGKWCESILRYSMQLLSTNFKTDLKCLKPVVFLMAQCIRACMCVADQLFPSGSGPQSPLLRQFFLKNEWPYISVQYSAKPVQLKPSDSEHHRFAPVNFKIWGKLGIENASDLSQSEVLLLAFYLGYLLHPVNSACHVCLVFIVSIVCVFCTFCLMLCALYLARDLAQ